MPDRCGKPSRDQGDIDAGGTSVPRPGASKNAVDDNAGLAISVRSVPRFTKDLDFAVAVASDPEAEDVVLRLRGRGYQPVEVLEQTYGGFSREQDVVADLDKLIAELGR